MILKIIWLVYGNYPEIVVMTGMITDSDDLYIAKSGYIQVLE